MTEHQESILLTQNWSFEELSPNKNLLKVGTPGEGKAFKMNNKRG